MESITFLKFWKLTDSPSSNNLILPSHPEQEQEEEEEEEDSFFDLELFSHSSFKNHKNSIQDYKLENPTKLSDHIKLTSFHEQTDSISKRKVLPIEPNSKPQSPIQLLKSAPKFPVFIFKKHKSMVKNRAAERTSKLSREDSTRKKETFLSINEEDPDGISSSKRFPKEMVQKYLKLIKPLYDKVLRKYSDSTSVSGDPPADSSVGIRSVCKHLGKSKSASASASASTSVSNRRDDSLLQQHDGIQGAILHCKRSFNASTEHSLFSRSDSAPSHERQRSLYSKDFSIQEMKEEGV